MILNYYDMADLPITNLGGLNIYVNPLLQEPGNLIRAVNVDSFPYGGKSKRPGYSTFLGTADGSTPTTFFQWIKNDGTTNYLYRASGSKLYYYNEGVGTGDWTVCGNGTITAGARVGYAILDNTLIVCDGSGSTRHTTNGTAFTNTTAAPIAVDLEEYQNKIYAAGTSSTLFHSTTGDATNWSTSGTADSSSLTVPGGGKLLKIFKQNDRLIIGKNSNLLFKWDGYSLVDTATALGPSSPYSVAKVEDFALWLNRMGIYGYGGVKPQLISNPIQRQIYNNSGSGIVGSTFDTAPGETHRFDYLLAVGTITEDFTNETISNAIIKYDYQKNEFLNYKFYNFPTGWLSYKDRSGDQQLIFGASGGQCYKLSGSTYSDNGQPIECIIEFVVHAGVPHLDKKWNHFWSFFNPGNEAKIQIAVTNTYRKEGLNWIDLGDCSTGTCYFRFPTNARGKLLLVKITESSTTTQFNFYGVVINGESMLVL